MATRRDFLKFGGALAGGAAMTLAGAGSASASSGPALDPERRGVLCDFTLCVGCRSCEWACASNNDLPHTDLKDYEDASIMAKMRRPDAQNFTVINQFDPAPDTTAPFHAKFNCLHCEHPACVSACIVGALEKNPLGPVTYDAWKCIGCRYCMVACPFQIPAYEYGEALTPRVMKCTLCAQDTLDGNRPPACVDICPQEAMIYGRRDQLLAIARERIAMYPDRYIDHVYGEHEVGGTSWLYLSDRSFQNLSLPDLPDQSPAVVTENIQHGIFRGFSGPLMMLGLVSVIMKSAGQRLDDDQEDIHE